MPVLVSTVSYKVASMLCLLVTCIGGKPSATVIISIITSIDWLMGMLGFGSSCRKHDRQTAFASGLIRFSEEALGATTYFENGSSAYIV